MSFQLQFTPRSYQKQILLTAMEKIEQGLNPIIELDCGLGKRYLQLSLICQELAGEKIILLLQASTSLYETFEYFKKHAPDEDVSLIDSRIPSILRGRRLKEHRVILTLPQTLANTLKKFPNAIDEFSVVIINEVDQIIRRMGMSQSLKMPYPKLISFFSQMTIIGMSGTLRDEHYILDSDQIRIQKELVSLKEVIKNSYLIPMDSLSGTDINDHISISEIIPTIIDDVRISLISNELEYHIDEIKSIVLDRLKSEDLDLYIEAKKDFSKLFGPLPIEPDLMNKFHSGYLTRKYLWAMSGKKAAIHLIRYGLEEKYVWNTMPNLPGKFIACRNLVLNKQKSVILCSYLDSVSVLDELFCKSGIKTVVISGQVSQSKRAEGLIQFRESEEPMVAILSNVGERDLDIPEAELLIIFDLINTTKTVYQKLKRSRGGTCRILVYKDTKEMIKAKNVLNSITEKYPWSTELFPPEFINI